LPVTLAPAQAQGDAEDLKAALQEELYSAIADLAERQAAGLESRPETEQVRQLSECIALACVIKVCGGHSWFWN